MSTARVARFAVVGSLGFAIDGGIMTALNALGDWSPVLARSISFPLALTLTWAVNRAWTFADRPKLPVGREYVLYAVVQTLGLIVNFSLFAALIRPASPLSTWHPIVALAVGAVVSMVLTYSACRLFVFNAASTADAARPKP